MQNMYLKLDGIDGESASKQGDKQIEVLSFSHNVTMPVSAGHASGPSVKHGRCDHSDLTITKYIDKTTPKLNQFCSGGTNIKTAELTMFRADKDDGEPTKFYTISLEDVIVTSIAIGGSGHDSPTETITLHYNKIKWTYIPQKRDAPGGAEGNVASGWDLEKNTKV